ncbi:MAG: hypothetical protein N3A57_06565 [Negativicutes bacterium]|nr:hypothetical protein [Negativicutes bacterium]
MGKIKSGLVCTQGWLVLALVKVIAGLSRAEATEDFAVQQAVVGNGYVSTGTINLVPVSDVLAV